MNNKAYLKPKIKTLFRKTRKDIHRNSHPEVFYKKTVLKHFAQFTENLCRSLVYIQSCKKKIKTKKKINSGIVAFLWIFQILACLIDDL